MRHTLRVYLGILLVASCGSSAVAEGGSWWPFGSDDERNTATIPGAAVATDQNTMPGPAGPVSNTPGAMSADETPQRWMVESPWAKYSWPRVHMPQLPKPHFPPMWVQVPEEEQRNTWVDKPVEPPQPSPLARMKAGTQRAWDKTVDALTPGEPQRDPRSTTSRTARRDTDQPFWRRMFEKDPRQPKGPQTVTEWMAQDRLDP